MKYEGLRCSRWLTALLVVSLAAAAAPQQPDYPPASRVDQTDTYHGVEVADPYRWLEDERDPATRAFAAAQDALTAHLLNADPLFNEYRARFLEIQQGSRQSTPMKRGDRIFYMEAALGSGSRAALRVIEDGTHRTLLDSEAAWPDSTRQVMTYVPDRDGRFLIVALNGGMGTPIALRVLDVDSGELLADEIPDLVLLSMTWAEARGGFYYAAYQIPAGGSYDDLDYRNQQVRFHRLGTPHRDDTVVHARPDQPEWRFGVATNHAGDTLVINAAEARRNVTHPYLLDLTEPGAEARALPMPGEAPWTYIDDDERGWVFQTLWEAPLGRLVRVHEGSARWDVVVSEQDATLGGMQRAGDRLLGLYVVDARRELRVFDREGTPQFTFDLPGIGGLGAFASPHESTAMVNLDHVGDPRATWLVDVDTGDMERLMRANTDIDPDRYVIEQAFVTSADGTRVPVSMVRRSDLRRDGTNPVFMYGYGAWSWAAYPYFQTQWHLWVESGGIFAVPNIRGGGEYGEEWHQAGIKLQKRNAFDDMIAAAEWFADSGWSAPGRIVANGGSASGLLAAAVAMMRPDLFGGAVIDHPGLDLIRSQAQPGGQFLVPEYGSIDDPQEFRALLEISPYHNVEQGACYPPMLVTVGEADRSTVPMHGLKFIAAVQHATSCDNPALLEWVPHGGHLVFGTTHEEQADILARQLVFARRATEGAATSDATR